MFNNTTDLRLCLSLNLWDDATEDRQESAARAVLAAIMSAREWRSGWEFSGLEGCSLGRQSHRIARFAYGGHPFVLIPGAVTRLGWGGEPLTLGAEQQRQWEVKILVDGGELPFGGFKAVVRSRLSAERHARIYPFLIHAEGEFVSEWAGEVERDDDVLPALASAVAAEGFRLPSADEWEWAARGGETGLFRWGDLWPDATPNSSNCPFYEHRLPNGFGLSLPGDTFDVECVADPAVFVGGDGGERLQLERPPLETWIPLASAFQFPATEAGDALGAYLEAARFRRVLPLARLIATGSTQLTSTGERD